MAKQCDAKEMTNASGQRDACIVCASFSHSSATCPERANPNALCILCGKGKHSSRSCTVYVGSFKKVVVKQQQQQSHK